MDVVPAQRRDLALTQPAIDGDGERRACADARVKASGAQFAVLHSNLLASMPGGIRGALRADLRWRTAFARWVLTTRCGPPIAADESLEVYDLSQWDDATPLDPDEVARRFEQHARRLARQARLQEERAAPR